MPGTSVSRQDFRHLPASYGVFAADNSSFGGLNGILPEMGHLVGKDIYRQLGKKIDGLSTRAPWSDALRAILKELYSEEDAQLIVAMPWGLSRIERLERATGLSKAQLERQLDSLCPRGLVLDVCIDGEYYYAPSPMVIGIFEFTMMRTGAGLDHAKWARLFREYMDEGKFYAERRHSSG